MTSLRKWKAFWSVQSTPLHYGDTEDWYRRFAEEINALVDTVGYTSGAVLESGCGNGALFEYLRINKSKYLGVDFSESMLKIFRSKFPDVSLVCADASSFYTDQRFDLIFSNGVVQYFDWSMIQRYVHNSYNMLERKGSLLMVNIPWKDLRMGYISGAIYQRPTVNNAKRYIRGFLSRFRGNDMGFWYNPQDFFGFSRLGFEIILFGSLYHPYRFSIALKKER